MDKKRMKPHKRSNPPTKIKWINEKNNKKNKNN